MVYHSYCFTRTTQILYYNYKGDPIYPQLSNIEDTKVRRLTQGLSYNQLVAPSNEDAKALSCSSYSYWHHYVSTTSSIGTIIGDKVYVVIYDEEEAGNNTTTIIKNTQRHAV